MRYVHTNIIARDWEALADFYIKVFDCTVKPPLRDLSGDWLDAATGLTAAHLKGAHLLLPGYGEDGPTLEIFSYDEMKEAPLLFANHTGFAHIAFEVDDVDATYRLAKEHGAGDLGQVTEKVLEGRGTLKLVYFRDPEGNIVEILSMK